MEYNPPLIRTKLNKPCLDADLIQRPRLLDRLITGLQRKITLVSAPAGFGKTMQICMWLDNCQCPTAWISLDEADNSAGRFWSYVIVASQTLFPEVNDLCLTDCVKIEITCHPERSRGMLT